MKLRTSDQSRQPLSGQWRKLQRRMAKWSISLGCLGAFSSCSSVGDSLAAVPSGWSGNDTRAYRAGHADGSRDRREGRRSSRESTYPEATRTDYRLGYDAGYKNPHDNPWSKRRARQIGWNYAALDRKSGLVIDPQRHASKVPTAVRAEFLSGYQDGWSGAAQ